MLKKLNIFILALLFLSQTVLGPMTAVAGTVDPVADEKVVEQSVSEQEDDEVEEPSKSEKAQEEEGQTESTTSAADEKSETEEVEQESTEQSDVEEESTTDQEEPSTTEEEKSSKEETTQEESEDVEEESADEDEVDKAVQAAYETAKKAVEKALKSEKKADIEKAFELIEAVEDEELQAELIAMLGDLQIRPAAEQDNKHFDLKISEIQDLQGNAYDEGNPLKPDDEFWVKMDWKLENGHNYQAGDTVKFHLPKELDMVAADEGELKDSAGQVVAAYSITKDGEITLTFTDFVEDNSNVAGWLEIRAELDKNEVQEEDGKVVIGPIDDEGDLVLPLDRSPIEKTVEKQGEPNKSYNADEIDWTVTINKNANALKDVTLEDLLPAGTEYVEGSLKAQKQAATLDGTLVGEKTDVSVSPSAVDGKLSIPLGDIHEVYTLTYTTKVTDTEVKEFKNNVTFKDADLEDTKAEATVTIDRGEPLKKGAISGYDPKTGTITWYLEFNYDQQNLEDVTLADNWTPADKIELVEGSLSFQEMAINENGQASTVGEKVSVPPGATLTPKTGGFEVSGITTDKAYKVVYKTKVTDRLLDQLRMENTASFGDHEAKNAYNMGQAVGAKSAGTVDYDAKTIEWRIEVNADERQMNDVEIQDELGAGLTLIEDSIEMTIGGQKKTDYTLEGDNPFTLSNIGDTDKKIIVTYKTKFDADHVPQQLATNKALISWVPEGSEQRQELEVNAQTQLNTETVQSSWKHGSYNPDTKEITWTIIANYRENSYDDFNISDTPQGNQQLIEDSIQVIEMKVNAGGAHVDQGPAKNADISLDGNAFNVHLGKTDKAYKVVYKTSVAGLDDLAKEYANEAQVKDGDKVLKNLEAKVGVYGDRKYGNKRGEQDGRRVNWSIDVNLAQEKISNLALEDTISDNQAYIEESIKVYDAKLNADGTISKRNEVPVPTSEYDIVVNETDFTISWKNDVERAFIVEYSTLFFAKDAENVRNEYKVTGDGITEDDSDASAGYNVTIKQTSGGGAEGTAGYLLVHKIDATAGQAQQPLAGIQFELIDSSNDQVIKTVTTTEEGYADFGRLLFGEYKLREVNPPEGYFGFEEQMITIDKEFKLGESDPLDYQLVIENYQSANSVNVVKRDDNGDRLANATFTLYKADGTELETKTTDDEGKLSFVDLEVGQYYIQETKAPNGFELDEQQHAFEITAEQQEIIQLDVENKRLTTSVEVAKVWKDDEGETEMRPDHVMINLLQNGQYYGEYKITEADGWTLTIEDLPAVDENGDDYTYTMTEQSVLGYAPSYSEDGLTVTNTRQATRDIMLTKSWLDDYNKDGNRPSEITALLEREVFELTDDGYVGTGEIEEVGEYIITAENDWAYEVKDLPVFNEKGLPYSYEYKEINVPEGYKTESRDADITNTRVGKTDIKGEKFWKDDGDIDNRPQSITVYLTQNGEQIAEQKVRPNEGGQWLYSFDDLEKYDIQGAEYHYSIHEEPVYGYESMPWSTTPGIINIDNTRVGNTGLFGTKTWNDGDNAENTRPASIEVQLLQNGEPFGPVEEVTAASDWTYEFAGLPSYDDNGVAYEYSVEEIEVDGYKVSYDGNHIINTLVGETEVTVTKKWQGEGLDIVAIQLLANGEVEDTTTITSEDDWTHTFTGLAKYDNDGVEINYTVEEVDIAGYASEITGDANQGFTITNTRSGETDVSVTKAWLGAEGDRATVRLLANGEKVEGQSVDLTADTDWRHTFEALDEFDAKGEPIEYTVEEEAVKGFTPQYDGNVDDGFFITNVRSGETSVDITKTWKDEEATDRPESIQVNLLANDVVVSEHDITAENDWTLTIDELPKYDENGEEIVYAISEQDVAGYESAVDGFDITNTRADEKSITIHKTWLDDDAEERPTSIGVELFRSVDGGEPKSVETYTVSAENDWSLTIDALPVFDTDGKAYTYEIEETAVEGYHSTVNGFDITNLREGKTTVDVEKVWKGEEAESATVYLLANGEEVKGQEVDLTKDNDWMHTFADLDQYDEQGKEITYTVKERSIEGYASNVTGNMNDGFTVTNLRIGTTVIAGTKTWADDGAEDERPKSITIQVLQNGAEYDTVTVTPKSNWTYSVPNLPKYDENGKAYDYTVVEDDVEGYESSVDGFDITNTRVGTRDIEGMKTWDDKGAEDKRPLSITIQILQNGEKYDTVTVTPKSNWTYNVPNLPKYDESGKAYEYTVVEDDVEGYRSTVDDFDITNTLKTYAIGDYVWVDRNKDGIQDDNEEPLEGVKVELYDENGDKVGETTTDENGRYLFDELPAGKYKVKFTLTDEQAKKYQFTKQHAGDDSAVDSDADEKGWTTEITLDDSNEQLTKDYADQDVKATEGIDPTWDAGVVEIEEEAPAPEVIEVTITKTWKDDQVEHRPEAIEVTLFANDQKVSTREVTAKDDWTLTVSDLVKFDDSGKEITYTISETEVEGYEAIIDGFDITNTWIDEGEDPVIPGEEDEDEEETEDPKDPSDQEDGDEEQEKEDSSDQEDGKDESTTDKGDDKSDGDQGQEDGNTLPKTATNTFTIGLVGIVLLLIGLVAFVTRRKRLN